jgi:hypothetical protein
MNKDLNKPAKTPRSPSFKKLELNFLRALGVLAVKISYKLPG